jgi:hypothetical protein
MSGFGNSPVAADWLLREPKKELRKNSWFLMRFFRGQLDTPWLCVGDFNEVLLGDEYFGAHGRERW